MDGTMNEEGARNLCAAVVRLAMQDYERALKHPKSQDSRYKNECERFFRSDVLNLYSDYDGEELIRKIRKQVYEGRV